LISFKRALELRRLVGGDIVKTGRKSRMCKTRAFSLSPLYLEKIERAADSLGITQSEFIRRSVDAFLEKIEVRHL
jgi:hypothetical protein